ncbi:MAG: NAD(P)H-dependent oxidoreductase [Actinobacteria bacterium]|nr:MAG: NAD(P)H-dependent oxidoreductase [Actinomycetota bacterium]
MKIVGLGGSLAATSRSRAALVSALAGSADVGAETELLDLRLLNLPLYNPDAEPSATTSAMIEALESADGLLWSSPLYQGSVAGSFKNALDWLHLPSGSVYLTDKAIGLISVSGGTQGLQAINAMEFSVRALRGWAVPYVVPVPGAAFDEDDEVRDPGVERQLKMLGSEVVRLAAHFADEEEPDHRTECARARERVASAA